MTTDTFCYWLKGFFELANPDTISDKQLQIIKDHLELVFNKVTPIRSDMYDSEGYNKLYTAHNGVSGLCGLGNGPFNFQPPIKYC